MYYYQPIYANESFEINKENVNDSMKIHADLKIINNTDKDLKIVLWPTIKNET